MDEKIIIEGKLAKTFIQIISMFIALLGLLVFGVVFSIAYPPFGMGVAPEYLLPIGAMYLSFTFLPFVLIAVVFYLFSSKIKLTVTNKRVYGNTSFGKRVDLPLDMISAVGTSVFKSIAITTSSGAIKFAMIDNRNDIYDTISNLLMDRQKHSSTPTTPTPSTSNADELKKYKELFDNGVITQEEFDAKKKQLLGL